MSRSSTCLVLVVLMSTYSYADPVRQLQNEQFKTTDTTKDKQNDLSGGMAPKMSKIVDIFLTNAAALQLTEKQKESLSQIREKYLYPLITKEAEYHIAQMKVNNLMRDPNFDTAQAKKETKILEETALEMANISIDALAEIRSVIGIENFKSILSMQGQNEKN